MFLEKASVFFVKNEVLQKNKKTGQFRKFSQRKGKKRSCACYMFRDLI